MVNMPIKGFKADGTLPDVPKQQVIDLVQDGLKSSSSSGGVYLDSEGMEHKYIMVASDTEPAKTVTRDGQVFEVIWLQTAPPDPSQHTPKQVTMDASKRTYVVPTDAGATYKIDGTAKPAGTYTVAGMEATTLTWEAVAKSGYTFKSGAVTSGSLIFPVKSFGAGDVMMSDSFNRADAPLGGSQSDSFSGGIPYTWKSTGLVPVMISNGYATPADSIVAGQQSFAEYTLPAVQPKLFIEFTPKPVADKPVPFGINITTGDGKITIVGETATGKVGVNTNYGGVAQTALTSIVFNTGDKARFTYDPASPKFENLTTGVVSTAVAGDPTRFRITGSVASVQLDMRHEKSAIGDIKVGIPQ